MTRKRVYGPNEEPVMVTPGVGTFSRHCSGVTQKGVPCQALGPWDWEPSQGSWYCHHHLWQSPKKA